MLYLGMTYGLRYGDAGCSFCVFVLFLIGFISLALALCKVHLALKVSGRNGLII
jgi:hypothetical protein